MSLDNYIEMEQRLAAHDLSRDGRCRCWVLYIKGYPGQVIVSCKTTRKKLLISDGHGAPVRHGHGYTVTNVYTGPTYRRKGMAAYLLQRVQEQMDADSECSVLYSDSGRTYYASRGWHPVPSEKATITILSSPSLAVPPQDQHHPKTRPLQPADIPALCKADERYLTRFFNSLPADSITRFAFLPTHAQISWHLDRAELEAAKISPSPSTTNTNTTDTTNTIPLTRGAITLNNTAWTYWAHDWRDKRLRILRLWRANPGTSEQRVADVAALLEAAVSEARRWRLKRVVVGIRTGRCS
jgi:GNAT superfamily N-acetyltransferase